MLDSYPLVFDSWMRSWQSRCGVRTHLSSLSRSRDADRGNRRPKWLSLFKWRRYTTRGM